jgi:ankyrin repeat protein
MRKTNIIDELILDMQMDVDDKILLEKIKSLEDIDMPDSGGMTLLMAACIYDRVEIAKKLIELNADINLQSQRLSRYTALHIAVENRKIDSVKLLLTNNANPNLQDKWGNIPLMRASHQDIEMIKLLINYGSDCNKENFYGNSPYNAFVAYPEIIKIFEGEN